MRFKFRKTLKRLYSPIVLRRGQTAIEYILVTVALVMAFAFMFRSLQWILSKEFKKGGIVILKMYKADPY